MLVAEALEAGSLGMNECWFFSRLLDCCIIMGAKTYEDVQRVLNFAIPRLIWLEGAMCSARTLMMEKLRVFMKARDTIEWDD